MGCQHCTLSRSLLEKALSLENKERDLMLMHELLDEKLMEIKNNRCCKSKTDLKVASKLKNTVKKLHRVVTATKRLNEDIRCKTKVETCAGCENKRQELYEQIQTMLQRLQTCQGPCLCGEKALGTHNLKQPKVKMKRKHTCGVKNILKKIICKIFYKKKTKCLYQKCNSSNDTIKKTLKQKKQPKTKKPKKIKKYLSSCEDLQEKMEGKRHGLKISNTCYEGNEKSIKVIKDKKQRFKKYSSKNDVDENTTSKTKDKKKKKESKEKRSKKDKDKKRSRKSKEKLSKKTKGRKRSSQSESEEESAKKTKGGKRRSKSESSKKTGSESEKDSPKDPKKRKSLGKSLTKSMKKTKRRLKDFSENIDKKNKSFISGDPCGLCIPPGICRDLIGTPPIWIPIRTNCKNSSARAIFKQLLIFLAMIGALLLWSPFLACLASCYCCLCCSARC